MTSRVVAFVLAGALLLAGCANPTGNEPGDPPSTRQSAQTDDVGATVATVAAWSALISTQQVLVDDAALSCAQDARVVAAQELARVLQDAGDATSPSYLGMLPVERQQVVDQVIVAADDLAAVSSGAESPTGAPAGDISIPQCGDQADEGIAAGDFYAFQSLKSVLTEWLP